MSRAPTCLVFFLPKLLMYLSYSLTGRRSKREKEDEKSRSMSLSSLVLRVLRRGGGKQACHLNNAAGAVAAAGSRRPWERRLGVGLKRDRP